MKPLNQATILVLALIGMTGCSGGDAAKEIQTDNSVIEKPLVEVVGSIEKGPFVVGSNVIINTLTNDGKNTGSTIVTKTVDKLGNFKFSIESGSLLQISATGYYRNEITGELSEGTITLRSVYKSTGSQQQVANVNLLTHLASARALSLIEKGDLQFEVALKQAETEFLTAFNNVIPKPEALDFSNLSILEDTAQEASTYLLAVSALAYQYALDEAKLKSTNPDAELTALLNELESDFAKDGHIEANEILDSLRASHQKIDPEKVHEHLLEWREDNQKIKIPDINVFLDTDLDGTPNITDTDDDNDGIKDELDDSPFKPDFMVSDKSVTLPEDTIAKVNVAANDPLGTPIGVVVETMPKFGLLSGEFPELSYTPNMNFTGQDSFTYKLVQGDKVSDLVTVTLMVTAENDAPEIYGQPNSQITALQGYVFTPDYADVDGDPLQFSIENLPRWATFNTSNGSLQGTPNNDDVGTYSDVKISVSDGEYTTSLPEFSIEVKYSQLAAPATVNSDVSDAGYKRKQVALSWEAIQYAQSYDIELYFDEALTELAYSAMSTSNTLEFEQALGLYYVRTRTENPDNVKGPWSPAEMIDIGTFTRTFGGSGMDSVESVLNVADGQIILAHTNSTEVKEDVGSEGVFWLFKVDLNGNIQWQSFLDSTNYKKRYIRGFEILTDGSLMILATEDNTTYSASVFSAEGQFMREFEISPPEQGQHLQGFADTKFGAFVSFDSCTDWYCATTVTVHGVNLDSGALTDAIAMPKINGTTFTNWHSLGTTNNGDLLVSGQHVWEGAPLHSGFAPYIQVLDNSMSPTFSWNGLASSELMPYSERVFELDNGDFAVGASLVMMGYWVARIDRETSRLSNYFFEENNGVAFNGETPIIPSKHGMLFAPYNLNNDERKTQLIEFNSDLTKRTELTVEGLGVQSAAGLFEHNDGGTSIVMTSRENGKDSIVIIKR
ncbi:Ig-like domain-containing protein [Pseudoalteromonas sp. SMS1]|uniref:Ig-like domain-containing protein n=1 Tax=Pseudoalteromonas sp. SMS1 TaxID=2908894 RepID=UPI001F26ED4D|nr:Ig-like domain-containing protein [Pseudoalteromonas sp. SMS1]MCF2860027.1 Ig-like domain-containing protein [Pseudoalteromonas sp. SMS1]